MELVWEILAFAAKALVVTLAFLVCAAFLARLAQRGRVPVGELRVQPLDRRLERLGDALRHATLSRRELRKLQRARERQRKRHEPESALYVLDFRGDITASAVASLRHEVTAVLTAAKPQDRVLLRLESAGGLVHSYGLAASQLQRLRAARIPLTACIDKVAASGGYMMACVAEQIVAAPFAIIGSIGVIAAVPNAHRLLERHGVDYEELTAGQFKRTVSFLGENTPEGRRKFQTQLEETHGLFKQLVGANRPGIDLEQVATGEYWYASQARERGLVDRLATSDDELLAALEGSRIFHVSYHRPATWHRRFAGAMGDAAESAVLRLATRLREGELPRA